MISAEHVADKYGAAKATVGEIEADIAAAKLAKNKPRCRSLNGKLTGAKNTLRATEKELQRLLDQNRIHRLEDLPELRQLAVDALNEAIRAAHVAAAPTGLESMPRPSSPLTDIDEEGPSSMPTQTARFLQGCIMSGEHIVHIARAWTDFRSSSPSSTQGHKPSLSSRLGWSRSTACSSCGAQQRQCYGEHH